MIKVISPPTHCDHDIDTHASMFLAGGITNCPDWQAKAVDLFSKSSFNLHLYNPRRSDFDASNKNMTKEQIKWEHDHLQLADVTMFWFCEETIQPITLFELGKYCRKEHLVVGAHPNYSRRLDIVEQLKLVNETVSVKDSLEETAFEALYTIKTKFYYEGI